MLSKLLHVVLFLLGLFGTSLSICYIDPMPFWSWARHKIGYLDTELDRFDTIFIGSSRMHFSLIPEIFDRRMAELGTPTHSYNLALSGQRPQDFDEMVRWLVAKRPTHLKRVVIEICSWELDYREGDWMGTQEVEMRTARSFLPRLRSIFGGRAGFVEVVSLLHHHVLHTATNILRIGQGTRILDDLLARAHGDALQQVNPPPDAGFYCVETTPLQHMQEYHKKFAAAPEAAWVELAKKVADVAPAWLTGSFRPEVLRAEAASLRALGVEPIFVVMPEISFNFFGRSGLEAIRHEVRLLEFDKPQEHRPLYEYDLWWDRSHTGRKGAERFSSYLAERILQVEALPPGQAPPPRWTADAPPKLTAEWVAGAPTIACRASGLPFVGTVSVVVSRHPAVATLGRDAPLQIVLQADATVELKRTSIPDAEGRVDVGSLPEDAPLYAQLGVWISNALVVVSDVVRIEARR